MPPARTMAEPMRSSIDGEALEAFHAGNPSPIDGPLISVVSHPLVSWWSKALFLDSLLVSSFPAAFASLSYFTALARKSECGTFDLVGNYTTQSYE